MYASDSCISELDLSTLYTEPYDGASSTPPSPPPRKPRSLPMRRTVPLRAPGDASSAAVSRAILDQSDNAAAHPPHSASLAPDAGFGFPVPRGEREHVATGRPTLSRRKSSRKTVPTRRAASTSQSPRACAIPASNAEPTASNIAVLQSLAATTRLGERSLEELMAELYAISMITTGKPPQLGPVSSVMASTAFGEGVQPLGAGFEGAVHAGGLDTSMPRRALRAEFTFAVPTVVRA
ncbi:hypothetical protein C8Q77DRAFT_288769 [Trametes polyzona]|nr:hypothetical protein C8Q77DRAFT_288769 [Trametes polyzona]